ncbi:MAG: MOSC domain-containing protein [Nocardioides sp.]
MTSARVLSVNVGPARELAGQSELTAIDKQPVGARVRVGEYGVEDDEVGDKTHHGGVYQAVYVFAQEDLDLWTERLGRTVPHGFFGENLTTSGIDVNEALVGETWRIGTVLLEVVSVRIPCSTFALWLDSHGFDDTHWVKRFTVEGRPGPYLRVLEPGQLAAGDAIEVEHRPEHDVTVTTMFRALTTERSLLPRLAGLDRIDPEAREAVHQYVERPLPTHA